MKFSHLHVHTQYSLLDGASSTKQLYQKAQHDRMPALAISDHGNMFGAFEFVAEAHKLQQNGTLPVKPIVGSEFYITQDATRKKFGEKHYHQLLLCKNKTGYQNLLTLSHYSYTEGIYRKPRIDKKVLRQYAEGLIATSCCLAAMIPQTLLTQGRQQAEEELKWWLDLFGEDYYLEMQRHGIKEQEVLNNFLQEMSRKYKVPLIATNDVHYVNKGDAKTHEVLLCINTAGRMSHPKRSEEDLSANIPTYAADGNKMRYRFAFHNDEFYFKTTSEITALFKDIPQAIDNTNAIVDKIDVLNLQRDVLLPSFPLPAEFSSQHTYLEHLAWKGVRKRYSIITLTIEERMKFELSVIEKMGYSGYFLIVADCIYAVKKRGVVVGPGRGSAAGSLVAYAIGITNIDPIRYKLLFERFLNPERRGMPDIDTDFDDVGRSKVIDYIIERYGKNQSAQIATFNRMGPKNAIKDVARVYELPYIDSTNLSLLVNPRTSIRRQLEAPIMHEEDSLERKDDFRSEEIEKVQQLRKVYTQKEDKRNILDIAKELDGNIRNVSVHASGIIIAPRPIKELVPTCTIKDSEMLVSQIEGKYIEEAGMLKMDVLGLSNLSHIQATVDLIEKRHQKKICIDEIPLNDKATYQLYQRGDTIGTFQFESLGMRKYLRDLKPDKIEDLIALNAIYRPGPMQYIPEFIKRKQGTKKIIYDLPEMKEVLEETYGITIYQEQVMLLAQMLAGFSKGEADVLRKAMGKKQRSILEKMKNQFKMGATERGHPPAVIEKIWKDWESFAYYAFNKSHSTCYAYIAFQTAFLKANYPYEFIAALLEGSKDIKDLSKVIQEAKRMGIAVLCPDVNESDIGFSITKDNNIRFGLSSIKGFGVQDANIIIEERNHESSFKNVYHFMQCVKGRLGVGKIESLIKSGSLDCFKELQRSQYFETDTAGKTHVETLVEYSKSTGQLNNKHAPTLFGEKVMQEKIIPKPPPPALTKEWSNLERLRYEQEMVGTYISNHPLALYQFEFDTYHFTSLTEIEVLQQAREKMAQAKLPKRILVGGIVESAEEKLSKRGTPYLRLVMSDFSHTYSFGFSARDYEKLRTLAKKNAYIFIFLQYVPDRYRENQYKLQVDSAGSLEHFKKTYTREIHLHLKPHLCAKTLIDPLEQCMRSAPAGKTKLYLHTNLGKLGAIKLTMERGVEFSDQLALLMQAHKDKDALSFKIVF